jgi:putative colanic acid biosynthesis acetyltransferase WcaF
LNSSEVPYLGQGNTPPYSRSERIRRAAWALVQATLFRWSPRPCHGFRARLLRFFGAQVPAPDTVKIFPSARVVFPWKLSLAPHAMVGPRVWLYNLAPIEIGFGANVSQDCHLCSGSHDYRRWSMPLVTRAIVIERNVWLCAEVFVAPGVTIGELAVVGARSVVRGNLPARQVCAGDPCVPVKPRAEPQP